jgi:hypothetical protein
VFDIILHITQPWLSATHLVTSEKSRSMPNCRAAAVWLLMRARTCGMCNVSVHRMRYEWMNLRHHRLAVVLVL